MSLFRTTNRRDLERLKWVAILGPVGFVALLELLAYLLRPGLLSWPGRLVLAALTIAMMVVFYGIVFRLVGTMQARLARQNRELLALHRAALDIYGELSLDAVLGKVVEQARQLVEARYGVIALVDEGGRIQECVTAGLTAEETDALRGAPTDKGLLGLRLQAGQRLRISEVSAHPIGRDAPPGHPAFRSLLAVPVTSKGPRRGNLYVADKSYGESFSREDEATLARFAAGAALAVERAHLQERLQTLAVAEERARIAREMHDGMAQVLAYVNTKAQAVSAYLESGRTDRAIEQLAELARAAREVYTDVRESILALRTRLHPGTSFAESLRSFLTQWQDQSGIQALLEADAGLVIPPAVELQLLRIIQEALSNTRKHSGARQAWIELRRADGNRLVAVVRDDGSGFDPRSRPPGDLPRFGLAIMRERAEGVGGTLSIDSAPRSGSGTRVRIELPLSSE